MIRTPSARQSPTAESSALHRAETMYRTIIETAREDVRRRAAEGEVAGHEAGRTWVSPEELKYQRIDGSRPWAMTELDAVKGDQLQTDEIDAIADDLSALEALEDELNRQSLYEPLTGLANRTLLGDRLEQAIRRCEHQHTAMAVLSVDLDGFKDVNDAHGHPIGDAVLVRVAEVLQTEARPSDTIARVGGDEFVIVSEFLADADDAHAFADRICAHICAGFLIAGQWITVRVSIGIAVGRGGDDADVLLCNADLAMYQAKAQGGGRVRRFDDELRTRVEHRRRRQADLTHAIDRGELRVLYQPVVSVADERTVGAEALVRWQHPEDGLLEPSEFVPLAEESGLIRRLDEWVLEQACRQLVSWHAAGLGQLRMAVNMSAQQFGDTGLVDRVANTLCATGADPHRLAIEVTETAVMADIGASAAIMASLRAMGVTIAIDDFGTGRSSLAYLKQLPFDVLKIDRWFVEGLGRDESTTSIVAAVIAMGCALGLTIVAEGVDRQEQLASLRALGCGYAQGYRWARPLQADEFRRRALEEIDTGIVYACSRVISLDAPAQAISA
jgi:diguanylate cyclase (GGDEF)-like protein